MKLHKLALFLLLALTILASCKKDNESDPLGEYYLKGNLNGEPVSWVSDESDWHTGTSAFTERSGGELTGSLTAWMISSLQRPSVEVTFKTYHIGKGQSKSAVFNSFINTGKWSFSATEDNLPGSKSIIIAYTDARGIRYTSVGGSQAKSSFTVHSVTKANDEEAVREGLKIKISFSCTLYPENGEETSVALKNVEAVLLMENLL